MRVADAVAIYRECPGWRKFSARSTRLTIVCPVNHEADSVEQVRTLSDELRDGCRWVIVKNEAHSDTFKLYENSKTRRHLLDVLDAREIAMPRLYD